MRVKIYGNQNDVLSQQHLAISKLPERHYDREPRLAIMNTNLRRTSEQQSVYTRQATILRKNLMDWDMILRNPRGEDWPRMLGRLNAALNQTATMDRTIEDVLEHYVYQPRQSTANAQDIPFFLSTRLETSATDGPPTTTDSEQTQDVAIEGDPVQVLSSYENRAAALAQEYEDEMIRF